METWTVELFEGIVHFIGSLLSVAEWKAFVILCALTLAATQTLKTVWRMLHVPGESRDAVNVMACSIAIAASYFFWPTPGYWWVAGIIAGPASVLFFKISYGILKWKLPGLASALNFDRRKDDTTPPEGVERREGDK